MRLKYLIVGAGPTGLGAGWRLRELGEDSFLILEKNSHVGGLAASFTDAAGFTWDIGGHVVFSHFPYFDRLLDDLLSGDYLEHQRQAFIRVAGTWTPYPFQNNIRHLPRELAWECVRGLLPANRCRFERPCGDAFAPADFREWIDYVFGEGIAKIFMYPYNFKVWATPPERMSSTWIGERVSVVSLERVLKNIILGLDDVSFGPNNVFKFPLRGGTGEIFRRLAARLTGKIATGQAAAVIDPLAKTLVTESGETFAYDNLLFTGPLDLLAAKIVRGAPDAVREAAGLLEHNGALIAGVGLAGGAIDPKCWMYFPEDNCPFYRVTNFHNYSPNNVPAAGQRALMTEVSFSAHKPEDRASHFDRVTGGLTACGLLKDHEQQSVVSRWETAVDYAYPIPTLRRDAALATIQPWLEAHGVFGRGRFGGFKYEAGNMDHSVMQGVEWAQRMIAGTPETVYTLS
ncbi:MAG: FAD-dependent oxidoreductase [Desulfovibrionaceae bacterium]|nr:FAD-dependent oxidoreductase [Desulfovibrionaceae bacterium]MBF0515043.1 FAD-dependent oxidoreductase [Desulfovibrionaceae bacterium]